MLYDDFTLEVLYKKGYDEREAVQRVCCIIESENVPRVPDKYYEHHCHSPWNTKRANAFSSEINRYARAVRICADVCTCASCCCCVRGRRESICCASPRAVTRGVVVQMRESVLGNERAVRGREPHAHR